jgi:hypothetical protein
MNLFANDDITIIMGLKNIGQITEVKVMAFLFSGSLER